MSDDADSDSKTEEPTEKRIADALERGNVPMSREIPFLTSLCAYLIVQLFMAPAATPGLVAALQRFVDHPEGWRLNQASDAAGLFQIVALTFAGFVGPPLLVIMLFGAAGSAFQNAPRLVLDRIMPDFSRVSPWNGATRLFGPRGWTEFLKSALKLATVAIAVGYIVNARRSAILSAMFVDAADLPSRLLAFTAQATTTVLLSVFVIAAADFTWARIHWRRDQRMTKQEVKDEMKQAEGDRMVKARLRSLRLDRSRKRMLTNVPKATMVVVNPTHYAVAMRYVRSEGGAPMVLAKGVDLIALKIREIATEHEVPIIEDPPLARSLYAATQVDEVIPAEFYRAVAEIVHLLQQKRGSWPMSRKRLN